MESACEERITHTILSMVHWLSKCRFISKERVMCLKLETDVGNINRCFSFLGYAADGLLFSEVNEQLRVLSGVGVQHCFTVNECNSL